jgi:hypothetical protein
MRRDGDSSASDDDDDDEDEDEEVGAAADADARDGFCQPPTGSHCMPVIAAPPWRIAKANRARVEADARLDSFAPVLLAAVDAGADSIAHICRMLAWRRRPYTEWYLPSA